MFHLFWTVRLAYIALFQKRHSIFFSDSSRFTTALGDMAKWITQNQTRRTPKTNQIKSSWLVFLVLNLVGSLTQQTETLFIRFKYMWPLIWIAHRWPLQWPVARSPSFPVLQTFVACWFSLLCALGCMSCIRERLGLRIGYTAPCLHRLFISYPDVRKATLNISWMHAQHRNKKNKTNPKMITNAVRVYKTTKRATLEFVIP